MPYAHPSGQMTLSDYEYSTSKRVTRRQRFLEQLDARIPWEAWEALVEPHYPRPGNGRPPVELRTVFRSIETALVTKPFFTRHHEKFSLIITVCQ